MRGCFQERLLASKHKRSMPVVALPAGSSVQFPPETGRGCMLSLAKRLAWTSAHQSKEGTVSASPTWITISCSHTLAHSTVPLVPNTPR